MGATGRLASPGFCDQTGAVHQIGGVDTPRKVAARLRQLHRPDAYRAAASMPISLGPHIPCDRANRIDSRRAERVRFMGEDVPPLAATAGVRQRSGRKQPEECHCEAHRDEAISVFRAGDCFAALAMTSERLATDLSYTRDRRGFRKALPPSVAWATIRPAICTECRSRRENRDDQAIEYTQI